MAEVSDYDDITDEDTSYTFRFYFDATQPEKYHCEVSHNLDPNEGIDLWLAEHNTSNTMYLKNRNCFETLGKNIGPVVGVVGRGSQKTRQSNLFIQTLQEKVIMGKRTVTNSGIEDVKELQRIRFLQEQSEEETGVRVNFRWNREDLDKVKAAADKANMPYQSYIKKVLLEAVEQEDLTVEMDGLTVKGKAAKVTEAVAVFMGRSK